MTSNMSNIVTKTVIITSVIGGTIGSFIGVHHNFNNSKNKHNKTLLTRAIDGIIGSIAGCGLGLIIGAGSIITSPITVPVITYNVLRSYI